jgi:hypothetical protein
MRFANGVNGLRASWGPPGGLLVIGGPRWFLILTQRWHRYRNAVGCCAYADAAFT